MIKLLNLQPLFVIAELGRTTRLMNFRCHFINSYQKSIVNCIST